MKLGCLNEKNVLIIATSLGYLNLNYLFRRS